MFRRGVLLYFRTAGAISAEGPGVQQTGGRLEQVRTYTARLARTKMR